MFKGTYKLADSIVEICSIYEEVQIMCAPYSTDEAPQFTVSITEEMIEFEGKESDDYRLSNGMPEYHYPASYLETLAVYREIANRLLPKGVLLMHGSVVAVDGEAYMFTALSGTGKSTHVRLWRELFGERAVMVNDDKPLLRIDKDRVMVYGTPWDGKHHLSNNISVPLRAIVYLQRGEDNGIVKIQPSEMLPILLQQTYRPGSAMETLSVMSLLDTLSKNVTFYSLHCNMNPEAAQVAYDGMR